MYVSTNWNFGIGNATNVIKVLSIQSKICCIWTKVVVSTWGGSHREWRILGGVVCPTFILQLLHHLQYKHRMKGVWGSVWNWHTYTHLHVCSGVLWTQMVTTKNTKPGSWRSSARYPQRPPPDVEDPTGPQLSTLLSFGERRLNMSHHIFLFDTSFPFCVCECWTLINTSASPSNMCACTHCQEERLL